MPTPTPPPPLPDPDDDLPRASRRRTSATPARGGGRHPSFWSQLSPRAWAIIIAVLVVVLVLIVGALAGSDSKKQASTIKTDSAVSTLQSLLDGVDKDTNLSTCPFGSVTGIVDDVHDQIKVTGGITNELQKIVVGGKDSVNEVLCSATTPDDRLHLAQSMYVYATPAPKGSYTDYLAKTLLAGAKVKLETPAKYSGGTIYAYCVTPDAQNKGGCGADWVAGDNKLVIGMQLASGTVTAKQITAALQHELATLASRLGGETSSGSSVPDTSDTVDTTGGTAAATTDTTGGGVTSSTTAGAVTGSTRISDGSPSTTRPTGATGP